MKCELIRDMESVNIKWSYRAYREAKRRGLPYTEKRFVKAPAGTIIDSPQCWRLVQMGVAKPADEACKIAAGDSADRVQELAAKYDRQDRGMGYMGVPRADDDPTVSDAAKE